VEELATFGSSVTYSIARKSVESYIFGTPATESILVDRTKWKKSPQVLNPVQMFSLLFSFVLESGALLALILNFVNFGKK
jgi:hypothetical protein